MRILVTTCDQYLHLLTPYTILFNKYWPNQDVTILGFDDLNIPELPDNFNYVSLGRQSDFGSYWTTPLIPYIDNIEEDYFTVLMGDIFITGHLDAGRVKLLEDEIISGNAEKALLDTHLNGYAIKYKEGINKLSQRAPYRTTLHPAIWKKEYFKRYLKPNFTAWDFEIKNMPESQQDVATIITPEGPPGISVTDPEAVMMISAPYNIFKGTNVYEKGVPFPRRGTKFPWGSPSGIRKEDILLIYSYLPASDVVSKRKYLQDELEEGKLYN